MGDIEKLAPFIVVSNCVHSVIVGLNVCKAFNLIPDFAKRRILCGKKKIRYSQPHAVAGILVAAMDVQVPPVYEVIIPLEILKSSFWNSNPKQINIVITDCCRIPGVYTNSGGVINLKDQATHKIWTGNFKMKFGFEKDSLWLRLLVSLVSILSLGRNRLVRWFQNWRWTIKYLRWLE
ncbi:MAG TPA: hypothetical protein PLS50_07465 [Candidatus Dojkabacteria bacterium]|nr:hypothetical protein [Candidatus Dojkabacteria bacterium]